MEHRHRLQKGQMILLNWKNVINNITDEWSKKWNLKE